MQPYPESNPQRLTFDGIVALLGYIHAGDVLVVVDPLHREAQVSEATIMGHQADARWVEGMRRLINDGFADVDGGRIRLTASGVASLRRAWPAAPSLRGETE